MILVAGIGNVFLGDDGFGCEVVKRLGARPLGEDVRVVDFGIRGHDLAYALCDGYAAAVLVDVVRRGGPPGTLYALEPSTSSLGPSAPETHGMHPAKVLSLARELGGDVKRLRLVGCEPLTFGGEEEMSMGLSAPVAAAVEGAVDLVESIVAELRGA